MPPTQQSRFLTINTVLETDSLLIKGFSLDERLGRLFRLEVELASSSAEVDFNALVGTNSTVGLTLPAGGKRYFNGYISRFVQTGQERNFLLYRAILVPWLWFLTRSSDCRIFQNKKVPEIVEQIFKDHGFKDYKLKLSGSYRKLEYCVQYRETAFNFVSRLMEQEGIYYYFEHENGLHSLVLADSPSAHAPFEEYETLIYRPRTQGTQEMNETVTEWVIEKELQSGKYSHSDFNFKSPATALTSNAHIDRSHEAAGFEIYDYPGGYDVRDEGDVYAKLRIEELHAQHETLRGQATVRGISTGCKFALSAHYRADQNRDYVITSASLQATAGDYETGGTGRADFFACNFSAMPAAEPFRSARTTPKAVIQGPQTAFVVGTAGEEIDTDEFGRVKVQFHWDRYGKVDENSSCWVRVSQPWAGKGWGAINIPRIGQEVVVEFLEGDPDRPIITGRVYNASAKVPYELPANKTISSLKSNTSKGGGGFNEIRFEDKKGEEQVFIHAEKNADTRVKNDAFEWIGNNRHLVVKKDQVEHVENNRSEIVDADHTEEIGKDRHLKVVGKEAKAVDESLSLTVKGDVIEVFKANHSEQTTADYYLKADNVVIEALTNLTLKVGSSSIAIEAGGIGIKTSGEIKIESTGTTDIKATAPLTVESSATAEMKSPATTVKGDGMLTLKGGVVMIN
jgi:type VI secretion system secreted protein VgrG